MKSVQITRHGGPEVLKTVELPVPVMTEEGVRISIRASGLNFADVMMRMGLYPEAPKPPFTPGYEIAGLVTEVGPKVTTLKPGDEVVAFALFGGYTTQIVLPEIYVRKIPVGLTMVEAASIPVNFTTAWTALCDQARIRPGDRVLVQNAGGGVGVAAVQIAKQAGATVVGTVGSASKVSRVLELGAKECWTYDYWHQAPQAETGEFDIILDSSGGKELKFAFKRLAPNGRVVTFGVNAMVGGPKRSIFRVASTMLKTPIFTSIGLMMGNKGIFGLNMLQFVSRPEVITNALDSVLEGFRLRKYKTVVGKTFSLLSEAGAAQTYLTSRANIGKVVMLHDSRL